LQRVVGQHAAISDQDSMRGMRALRDTRRLGARFFHAKSGIGKDGKEVDLFRIKPNRGGIANTAVIPS